MPDVRLTFDSFYTGAPGPISIVSSPSITLQTGKPSNLTCEATNANPPATMSWYRDGVSRSGALVITKPSVNDLSSKFEELK